MRHFQAFVVVIVALFAASILSCGNGSESAEKTPPPESPAADARPEGLDDLLDAYEALRTLLAGDLTEGLAGAATALADSARAAASSAPENTGSQLEPLAAAAEELGAKAEGEIAESRMAFGEVSRSLVALLAEHPAWAEGRFLFECPMAEGYKKWVQTSDEIANPYFGKQMLDCGEKSNWSD